MRCSLVNFTRSASVVMPFFFVFSEHINFYLIILGEGKAYVLSGRSLVVNCLPPAINPLKQNGTPLAIAEYRKLGISATFRVFLGLKSY